MYRKTFVIQPWTTTVQSPCCCLAPQGWECVPLRSPSSWLTHITSLLEHIVMQQTKNGKLFVLSIPIQCSVYISFDTNKSLGSGVLQNVINSTSFEISTQISMLSRPGAIIRDGDLKSWDARGQFLWDNFSIFRTNCAILTSYIRADPRTCGGLSRGCCHVL